MRADPNCYQEYVSPAIPLPKCARRLQKLLDYSIDVICSFDKEGRFVEVSAAATKVWGYTPEELAGKYYMNMVVEEDRPLTNHMAGQIMSGMECTNFENHNYCRDGSIKSIIWSATWDAVEEVMYCVARDGTAKKAAEQKAKQDEQRLHRAFRLSQLGWWEWDILNKDYNASEELYHIYGLNRQDFPKITVEQFRAMIHPDDLDRVQESFSRIGEQDFYEFEHRLIKPRGEVIFLIHCVQIIRNEENQVTAIHGTTKDITKKKEVQIQLEESEKKLSNILESIGDGFIAVDNNWRITYWNKKAEEFLSRNRKEVLGRHLWKDIYSDAVDLKFYTEYFRAKSRNRPVHFEEYYPTLNMWVEVSACPTTDGLSVYFRNITDRKKDEEERKESKAKLQQAENDLQQVLESMSDGFYTVDRNWDIKYATDKIAAMLSVNKEDYLGRNLWEEFPEAVSTKFYTEYHRAFAENRFVSFEEYLATFNMWFEVNAYPQNGVLAVYVKDITERKNDKKRLEFIARATSEVIWERAVDSEEISINKENLKRVFGYDIANHQLHYSFWREKVHPEDIKRVRQTWQQALENGVDFYGNEYRFKKADGSWAHVKARTYILRDEEKRPERLIGAVEDITSEKLTEKALQESEQAYKELFDHAPLPRAVYDRETLRILDVNNATIEHYGYSREEALQMTILDLRPREDHAKVKDIVSLLEVNTRKDMGVWTHIKKGGEKILAEVYVAAINYKGKIVNMATAKDVTEKLKIQQELIRVQVEQQRSITQAVFEAQEKERSEIGRELHDNVNQILTTAKLYVENIHFFPEQKDTFIEKSTALLQHAINEIRILSRTLVSPTIRDIGFLETLEELTDSYQQLYLFTIGCSFDFDEACLDKELKLTLYRILQELFNNTVKYAKASHVQLELKQDSGSLCFRYCDDGIGFEASVRKNGMGLSNIQNRAELFEGKVRIMSSPGKGCAVEILFPISGLPNNSKT